MRWVLMAGALLLASLTGVAQAAPAGVEAQNNEQAAISRLTGLLNKASTLSGRFSQLTLDGSGVNLQETGGKMLLKRPGMMRWHTEPPLEQLLISNGKKVWLYDPDLNQVTVQSLDQRLSQTPALLLSGDISKISEHFTVSFKEGGDVVDFILKPKAKDSLFDTLRLSFRDGLINDMQLIDTVGQRTNILFMGVKLNQPISDSEFDFKAPAGADVIEE